MKAVILIGGEGVRLRPLTCNKAIAMVPVLNQPLLEHILVYLKKHDVDDIILTLRHSAEQSIRGYFGNGSRFGVKLTYLVEESPLGTAGAVKNAESFLDSSFIVLNGDVLTDIDLTGMLNLHREKKATATIALTPVENPTIYGVTEADNQGVIQRFIEKPSWDQVTTNMINAGIYIMEPGILSYVTRNVFSTFERDIFVALLERGQAIYTYPSTAYWIHVGTPQEYLKLHYDLLHGKSTSIRYREETAYGVQSIIHPTARIEGVVILGSHCTIGSKVSVKGPTVIGSNCEVLDEAGIERAVLWDNVQVGRQALLKNCIVSNDCLIGDYSYIPEGCVLGDNVKAAPGTKLQPGTRIWPGKNIKIEGLRYLLATPLSEEYHLLRKLIIEALHEIGMEPILPEEEIKVGTPIGEMIQQSIERADFVIADLTENNPNVMYEIGYAHALKKPALALIQHKSRRLPVDLRGYLYFSYDPSQLEELRENIQVWASRT